MRKKSIKAFRLLTLLWLFLNDAQWELQKNVWFRAQNSAKNNFLPIWLDTYLAWAFLFLCSFLNNYPWTLKKFVFQQAVSIKNGTKTKIRGSQGEKLAKRGIETAAVTQKITT